MRQLPQSCIIMTAVSFFPHQIISFCIIVTAVEAALRLFLKPWWWPLLWRLCVCRGYWYFHQFYGEDEQEAGALGEEVKVDEEPQSL